MAAPRWGRACYVKVAQVVAEEFQIDLDRVKITATTTGKVPNTSADRRLLRRRPQRHGGAERGAPDQGAADRLRRREISGAGATRSCSCPTGCASATRRSPSPIWSSRPISRASSFRRPASTRRRRSTGTATRARATPFYYFAYGAACSEVSVDTLTGEYVVERTDILHDVGRSLNPAIDIGQVEGGFVQGMGWLTTEELWWDDKGRLRTHAPSTYKIPLASDRPKIFNVDAGRLVARADEPTIHRSKAVGEPPLHARHLGAARAVGCGGERRRPQDLPAPRRAGDAGAGADGDRAAEGAKRTGVEAAACKSGRRTLSSPGRERRR